VNITELLIEEIKTKYGIKEPKQRKQEEKLPRKFRKGW
jgi:hypothetical protein